VEYLPAQGPLACQFLDPAADLYFLARRHVQALDVLVDLGSQEVGDIDLRDLYRFVTVELAPSLEPALSANEVAVLGYDYGM
jgi:hypothetical protein